MNLNYHLKNLIKDFTEFGIEFINNTINIIFLSLFGAIIIILYSKIIDKNNLKIMNLFLREFI